MRQSRCVLGMAACVVAAFLSRPAGSTLKVDTSHATRDRLRADTCILGQINIYTDPYIRSASNQQIVNNISRMCGNLFYLYTDDVGLDEFQAQIRLRRVIEAGLRGQFH